MFSLDIHHNGKGGREEGREKGRKGGRKGGRRRLWKSRKGVMRKGMTYFLFSLFATGSCDGTACVWRYKRSQWRASVISVPLEENGCVILKYCTDNWNTLCLVLLYDRHHKNMQTGKTEKPQVTMVTNCVAGNTLYYGSDDV